MHTSDSPNTQTSIRVSRTTRDDLARITRDEHRASIDDTLTTLILEHTTRHAIDRLRTNPQAQQQYQAEADHLATDDQDQP